MSIFNALILGIIEGLTEFLPISSTAHLIISSKLLGLPQSEFNSFFEVFIQSGAILAVVVIYWKLFINHKSYIINLIYSFIPTAIIGLLMHKIIKNVFFNSLSLITGSILIVGILFILVEWMLQKEKIKLVKSIDDMTSRDAFIIGLIQAAAIIPGVSRAGAVILIMICLRYKRTESAIYSFLLAVPTILAASLLDFVKTDFKIISNINNVILLITGFMVSFIIAFIVIRWFIGFLQKNTLIFFGIYRIILALLLIFI
jgi:undecaprenyl-diphosphatase